MGLPEFPLYEPGALRRVLARSKDPCAACGQVRGIVYTGPVYCKTQEPRVCPWCVADGTAAAKFDATFNDGLHPDCDEEGAEGELRHVEERTPGFEGWQCIHWWACCGRACRFLGEASAQRVRVEWRDLIPLLHENPPDIIDDVDEWVDSDTDSPTLFVFQCRGCGKKHFYPDAH